MTEESRDSDTCLTAEAQVQIDKELDAAGWLVQDAHAVNLAAARLTVRMALGSCAAPSEPMVQGST